MLLGSWRGVRAQTKPTPTGGRAWLTIPLDQWAGFTVTYRGKSIPLRAEDIFAALSEV